MWRLGRWIRWAVVGVAVILCLAGAAAWVVSYRAPQAVARVWVDLPAGARLGSSVGRFVHLHSGRLKVGEWRTDAQDRQRLQAHLDTMRAVLDTMEMSHANRPDARVARAITAARTRIPEVERSIDWQRPGTRQVPLTPDWDGPFDTRFPVAAWERTGIRYERSTGGNSWQRQVTGPIWMLVAVPLLVASAMTVPGVARRLRRKRRGLCLRCGYDLRASDDGCPECGEGRAAASG